MSPLAITLDVPAGTYRPVDEIRGAIEWQLVAPPKDGTLTLLWTTTGPGVKDEAVVRQFSVAQLPAPRAAGDSAGSPYRAAVREGETAPLEAKDGRSFRFGAPQAPYSFTGKLVSLVWEIRVELGGLSARREIVVSPTREVYVLE